MNEHYLTCTDCGEKFPFESHEHICKTPILSMNISGIKEALNWKPDKQDLELYLRKMRECLNQLKELESQWGIMEKPSPEQAGLPRFRNFWRVHKHIDVIYDWLKNVRYSNYPLKSQDDVLGYIEYWESVLEHD